MDLGEREIVLSILSKYAEISVIPTESDKVLFTLFNRMYYCIYPLKEEQTGRVCFLVKSDEQYDYPHILSFEDYSDGYSYICLYEDDNMIHFLQTYEEKVVDAVERLIVLLSLSSIEEELEFQKEFLYYWNNEATNRHSIYLFIKQNRVFQKMNIYNKYISGNLVAWNVISDGIRLNQTTINKKQWDFCPAVDAFYIPITDNRRILPPTHNKTWSKDDILKIIYGKDFSRISHDTYIKLKQTFVKHMYALLVFEMIIEETSVNFSVFVTFRNKAKDTLLNKLTNDISKVEIYNSQRLDYYYLCRQIGNDTSLLNKTVLLIGAGSLGSYVGKELVKAGIKNLSVYDSDKLSYENVLRHDTCCLFVGQAKVDALKVELEYIHPEILVKAINENIDEDSLLKELCNVDIVIFTVGSSDVQLKLNRILKQTHHSPLVIYAWLEAGGSDSHILVIDYKKPGCFECLFTNAMGELVNNKANNVSDEHLQTNIIRNGCGATRVAYGNTILLRTTAVLLETVKKIFDGEFETNALIDINLQEVCDRGTDFIEGKCQCCGNRNDSHL